MKKITTTGEYIVMQYVEKLKKEKEYIDFCKENHLPPQEYLTFHAFIFGEKNDEWMRVRATSLEECAASFIFYYEENAIVEEIEKLSNHEIVYINELVEFIEKKCLYEANPRIKKISTYVEMKKRMEEKAFSKEEEAFKKQEETIRSWKERITSLLEVANACRNANISIGNYFQTSKTGIIHLKGMLTHVGYELSVHGRGALFYTDGQEIGVKLISNNEETETSLEILEKFCEEFETFETEFYNYVDSVTEVPITMNEEGMKLVNQFVDYCKKYYPQAWDFVALTGTLVLEECIKSINHYIAWHLLTYDTNSITVVNEWMEDESRLTVLSYGGESITLHQLEEKLFEYFV